MAVGKSSIGQKLAARLEMEYMDLDKIIEQKSGMSIADIFNRYGEPHFRLLENKALSSLRNSQNMVLATGGGIVAEKHNREILPQMGIVIHLTASLETIWQRT